LTSPAEEPQPVQALHDLGDPVQKVAAGGYTVAALTKSGALYIWGMRPPGDTSKQPVIAGLDQIPNYTEVDEDKDVQDIAVGESHAIVLTTDGHVHVIGRNDNGQLGLGRATQASTESWTKLHLHHPPNHRVVSVSAGPRVSFILVSH
jgi:regulator of chromosome condensation